MIIQLVVGSIKDEMMIRVGGSGFKIFVVTVCAILSFPESLSAQIEKIDAKIEFKVVSESQTNILTKFWIGELYVGDSCKAVRDGKPFLSRFTFNKGVEAVYSKNTIGFVVLGNSSFEVVLRGRKPTKLSVQEDFYITLTDTNEYIPVVTKVEQSPDGHVKNKFDSVKWKPTGNDLAIGSLTSRTLIGPGNLKQFRLLDLKANQVLTCVSDGLFSRIVRTDANRAIEYEFIDGDSDSRLDFLRVEYQAEDKPEIHFFVIQDTGHITTMTAEMSAQFSKLGETKFLAQWRKEALQSSGESKKDK